MSTGLGRLELVAEAMTQHGVVTVADVMAEISEFGDFDPCNVRRAFKTLHRRGMVNLTVKKGLLAIKAKRASREAKVKGTARSISRPQAPPPAISRPQAPPAQAVSFNYASAADAHAARISPEVEKQKAAMRQIRSGLV